MGEGGGGNKPSLYQHLPGQLHEVHVSGLDDCHSAER